jgi:hypothetical protein
MSEPLSEIIRQTQQAIRSKASRKQAGPILTAFADWLAEQVPRVLPKSEIGKAVTYATNQWPSLIVYTRDGRLTIDTGPAVPAGGRRLGLTRGGGSPCDGRRHSSRTQRPNRREGHGMTQRSRLARLEATFCPSPMRLQTIKRLYLSLQRSR